METSTSLLKKFLSAEMELSVHDSDIEKKMIIFYREQLSPSASFQTLMEKHIAPIWDRIASLVNTATGGAISGDDALITAQMLDGLISPFCSHCTFLKKYKGWKEVPSKKIKKIKMLLENYVESILKGIR